MRSKIWSKIILIVCLCLVPEYSVFCVNFEEDDDRFGVDPIETEDRFGYFGDLMPPNFADFLSPLRRSNDDDFDDIDRYGKVKAENDNKEGFRSYIGNVFNPNPKAKNIFDVLNADTDDIDEAPIRSSNEQSLDDMDDDDDDDDGEVNRGKVKHPSMELIRRISPYWDKSNDSDRDDDRIIGKSASMKDSISRLIGIGHKSSTASPDEADGESKKDGGDSNDDDDDDDDDSDESDKKTTKMDGKSKGNIFSLLFSKSKKTSSDMDHKATTEANKLTTEKSSASNQTAFSDEDDDDDDDDEGESGDNSTSSSRASTIKASPESDSTIVTSLSLSTTDSTSTTSTTEKGKSHKHEEPSSTSSTPAPDNISSTEEVTKKHHKSHTSTMTMPSTTLAYETSHKPSETSPKNTKDTEGRDDDENKSNHKSSLEIIEAFLAGLGHESDYKKDNHNSTEVPATKSRKHSKTHKKKHGKKHKKTSALVPESMSTVLEETGSNFSAATAKSENKSTTGTEVSSTIKPKGDTTTAIPTSSTDLGASFPVISITRTTSNEKYPRTDSSTAKSHANSNSQGSSTTPMPTLGPYVEDSDDILVTNESIVYSDWNPDVFP